jgi:hypothetical protein
LSIRLSPKFGINPTLTFCPRCGGDANELVLAGDSRVYECEQCKQRIVGTSRPKFCPRCGNKSHGMFKLIGPWEGSPGNRLPASEPCEKCKEEIELHKAEVDKGGVYWKCIDCHSEGVVKAGTPFASMVREKVGIPAPKPAGVEFSKEHGCPVCGQKVGSA